MDKIERNFLIFLFILAFLIVALVFWLTPKEKKALPSVENKEGLIQKQLQTLIEEGESLPEEEIKKQLEGSLKPDKKEPPSLSDEEILKQLEMLQNL